MKPEIFIARRLNFKRNDNRPQSPAIAVAVIGVALAVIVMTVAVAVMLGFKHEIRDKVMGFDSGITIQAYSMTQHNDYLPAPVVLNDTIRTIITEEIPADATLTLNLRQPAILKTDDNFLGIVLNGLAADGDYSFISKNLIDGTIPDYSDPESADRIIVSESMANTLGLSTGDRIRTYFFIDDRIRVRNPEISAIYNSNFGEYDRTVAYCSLSLPGRLLGLDSISGGAIAVNGIAPEKLEYYTDRLQQHLADAYYAGTTDTWYQVDNVYHTGALYFNWLELLDTNVVVILILMACVSGFSLVSSLFIIILERVSTIGLLKAIGTPDAMIRRIFIYMAQRLVITGLIAGNLVAAGLVVLQHHTRFLPLDPEAYYLSYVPVELHWWHMILINAGILVLSWGILLIPAHIIARISPARTMRYE